MKNCCCAAPCAIFCHQDFAQGKQAVLHAAGHGDVQQPPDLTGIPGENVAPPQPYRLARPESVLHELLDRAKLENVLRGENVTWFGQLMSRPQLIAWLYQVDVWFDEYNIDLAL